MHYLPMPAALRMRGGLGTHWMMPQTVTLTDICRPDAEHAAKIDVERLQLLEMIVNLHPTVARPGPESEDCGPQRGTNADAWLAADRHAAPGREIVTALRPANGPGGGRLHWRAIGPGPDGLCAGAIRSTRQPTALVSPRPST
ncbi:MAG: hypothetical protein MZV70_39725 [Desulfobacterales bacterium]|nr:hypothetical protein [Desulfobacterales bacterium]